MSPRPLLWLDRLAHDLRGPLTPLQTAAYLLRSGQLDAPKQAELLELMERQTRRLGRMIDEVGDWSRASQDRLLASRDVNEAGLVIDMASSALTDADGVPLEPDFAPGAQEARLACDMQRIAQLLQALVDYSVARSGRLPKVRVSRAAKDLRIDLTDCGPPLDALSRDALLSEPLPEPPDEGLGLRLLVARAIAEAHGGTLAVEDGEGGGLHWRIELPLAGGAEA